mmetsp:Transcript_25816/g.74640  ORF Transcript_25816/g.74640 Transcript_25816/m.74640 type:complete len:261 (-) Transcript_25816:22-804(-)
MRPVLARPWVHLHNAMDTTHSPSWLSARQQHFAEQLFSKGIHGHPVLVSDTLSQMKDTSPQIAFAGRSNVGKSTLLNMLLHRHPDPLQLKRQSLSERRKLDRPTSAPVSHKPGRTRHLFRFELGGRLTLVDLPGYGFAAAPRAQREGWSGLIGEYFASADQLQRVVSLVDAGVGVKESDERLWEMLRAEKRQLMVVLTKVDKVRPEALNRSMAHVLSLLEGLDGAHVWPYVHAVSGLHGHGLDELRASLSAVASDASGRA